MQNDVIEDIILNHITDLEKLGHNMSDDNIINIVNGFIDISNSILPDGMQKTPNKELNNIISSNLYKNIKIKLKDTGNLLKSIKVDETNIDYDIKLFIPKRKFDFEKISNLIKTHSEIDMNKTLLKYLTGDIKLTKEGKSIINEIGKLIKKNENIIKLFQTGQLNKIQEEIIIQFFKNKFKL